ncbi:hypothetical protein NBO_387g0001 [Nosema bombycis CQ1]|uniref:Uncharacterized protein n=1 Tax=Nosema bombycis (strain CQ1 / CVCC 102059) TaxID=578461 RepID=R0MIL5_NOSB1|nr:hypothetical protein NBO_387g0001 [Nosema bombycis CQ1]|eukprot:EOB12643.1 hypothetical protein NBO_387g0001 [Nosema bombycis CQ1]
MDLCMLRSNTYLLLYWRKQHVWRYKTNLPYPTKVNSSFIYSKVKKITKRLYLT